MKNKERLFNLPVAELAKQIKCTRHECPAEYANASKRECVNCIAEWLEQENDDESNT